jgi:hypothetical protein
MLLQCYGNFPLYKTIYHFNGSIASKLGVSGLGGRFINTLSMWLLTIIPVYPISFLVDVIILNLIEFWTGKALIGHNEPVKQVLPDGSSIQISYHENGKIMQIKNTDSKNITKTFYVFKDKPGKFFNLIDNRYVEIEMKSVEKDINHFEIVYNMGNKTKSIIVTKNQMLSLQNRVSNIYELAQKRHEKNSIASVPVNSSVQ